jgi:hypothetical protein
MAPYRCLRELGGSGDTDAMGDYTLNRTLRDWLSTGEVEPTAPPVEGSWTSIEERRDHALERIRRWRSSYEKVFETAENVGDPFRAPRAYEMRDDILAAFTELEAGIESVRSLQASIDDFN